MPRDMYPPGHAVLLIPEAGQKWRPSNNIEADLFISSWCATCAGERGCIIRAATFWHQTSHPDYPAEWCLSASGQPQCTAYVPKAAV